MDEFFNDKAVLEKKLTENKNEIHHLKEQNQKNTCDLEKAFLVEKVKLKEEMLDKLNELAKEFRAVFYQHMGEYTKKVMRQNYLLNLSCQKLSATTDRLSNENKALKQTVNFEYFSVGLNLVLIMVHWNIVRIEILKLSYKHQRIWRLIWRKSL